MLILISGNTMAFEENSLPVAPGFHDIKVATSGVTIDVSLAIPENLDVNAPLVLVLHYAGQPTAFYGRPLLEHLIWPRLGRLNAIFVAPTSVGGDWRQSQNVKAIFELLEIVEKQFQTDPSRRAVTGFSMGAIGAWHMQAINDGYFSAAIPIAGYPQETVEQVATPTYAIMSNADKVFALEPFERLIATLRGGGAVIESEIVSGVDHYDLSGFSEAVARAAHWLGELWSR